MELLIYLFIPIVVMIITIWAVIYTENFKNTVIKFWTFIKNNVIDHKYQKANFLSELNRSHRRLMDHNLIDVAPKSPGIIVFGIDNTDKNKDQKFFSPRKCYDSKNIKGFLLNILQSRIRMPEWDDIYRSYYENLIVLKWFNVDSPDKLEHEKQRIQDILE